jgi:Sulfotransferase family
MQHFQIKLSAQQLMSKARELAGINDVIDSDIEETLEMFLRDLNTEAELHEDGAEGMERNILLVLCNRLRMLRDFKNHPEINDQVIAPPIIMSGAGRSGSTKLHKMLAATGDFNSQPCWQGISLSLLTGNREEDPAERIRVADEWVRWFNDHAPDAKLSHEFSTFETEEDILILAHRFIGPYMVGFSWVPNYVQWYVTNRNRRDDLKFLKKGLQYLQWQFPDCGSRPWVLKSPLYLGSEHLMAEVFPGAKFVSTNRDPVSTVSSASSLIFQYHIAYSETDRRQLLGPMMLEGFALSAEQQMAVRDGHPELRVLDIGYTEVTKSAEHAVEKVYAHAGMSLSDKARESMCKWEAGNKQHKHGVHQYKIEEFGLTKQDVQDRFSNYIGQQGANL